MGPLGIGIQALLFVGCTLGCLVHPALGPAVVCGFQSSAHTQPFIACARNDFWLCTGRHYRILVYSGAQLLFCTIGEGNLANETYGPWSSAEIAVGESISLIAKTKSEFYVFGLPNFPTAQI